MMTIAGIKSIGYYQDLATEDYYVKGVNHLAFGQGLAQPS
jgi:hypothetical protein